MGLVRSGMFGVVGQVWNGKVCDGEARLGQAGSDRLGLQWLDPVGYGR
jgi:hypothetical protein